MGPAHPILGGGIVSQVSLGTQNNNKQGTWAGFGISKGNSCYLVQFERHRQEASFLKSDFMWCHKVYHWWLTAWRCLFMKPPPLFKIFLTWQSCYIVQAGLNSLCSSDPSASVSWIADTTGSQYSAWPEALFLKFSYHQAWSLTLNYTYHRSENELLRAFCLRQRLQAGDGMEA
jgi:hypothetical protein